MTKEPVGVRWMIDARILSGRESMWTIYNTTEGIMLPKAELVGRLRGGRRRRSCSGVTHVEASTRRLPRGSGLGPIVGGLSVQSTE